MSYEIWIAGLAVLVLHYLFTGRVTLASEMWALMCVFFGYLAGALHVIHAVLPP